MIRINYKPQRLTVFFIVILFSGGFGMLGEKCLKVLDFLRKRAGDTPPTVREICAETGIKSTSCVHRYLRQLEELGHITRTNTGARGYKIAGFSVEMVPVVGSIAAGRPILAVEDIEACIPHPFKNSQEYRLFALKVKGESMKDAAILDGDIVVAKQISRARNGQIVIALIEDEATVKRYFFEDGRVRLQPENDAFDPIFPEKVEILGVVTACLRNYE